jgi:hypothetical protein
LRSLTAPRRLPPLFGSWSPKGHERASGEGYVNHDQTSDDGGSCCCGHLYERLAAASPGLAIIVCAALFDHGAGIFAVLLSAVLAKWFLIEPTGTLKMVCTEDIAGLFVFVAIGAALLSVLPLGILFGAIHALTPGHGKSVLASDRVLRRRGALASPACSPLRMWAWRSSWRCSPPR